MRRDDYVASLCADRSTIKILYTTCSRPEQERFQRTRNAGARVWFRAPASGSRERGCSRYSMVKVFFMSVKKAGLAMETTRMVQPPPEGIPPGRTLDDVLIPPLPVSDEIRHTGALGHSNQCLTNQTRTEDSGD